MNPRSVEMPEDLLREVEANNIAIKSAQFVGGSNLLSYKTFSSNLYDHYFRIFETANTRSFKLTFTHDRSTEGALLRLRVFARADNSAVMADPIPYRTPTAPALFVRWYKIMPPTGNLTEWVVVVAKGQVGVSFYDAYFKFYIDGTDSGSWSITML